FPLRGDARQGPRPRRRLGWPSRYPAGFSSPPRWSPSISTRVAELMHRAARVRSMPRGVLRRRGERLADAPAKRARVDADLVAASGCGVVEGGVGARQKALRLLDPQARHLRRGADRGGDDAVLARGMGYLEEPNGTAHLLGEFEGAVCRRVGK